MEAHELPMLRDIFQDLRRGRHIGLEDGAAYASLIGHKDEFQVLFTGLGLNLQFHDHGFFYLDDETAPRSAQRIALFTSILVEDLDDKGLNLDQELTHVELRPTEFPHLKHDKYIRALGEVEISSYDSIMKVLKSMERYGFVVTRDDGTLRFRTAAYRLLDILNNAGRSVKADPSESEVIQ